MSINRVGFVDTLKAIGIYFVFLGHSHGLNTIVVNYVYSFHMPLFFFISGMFLRPSRLEFKFGKYFVWKLKERLVPYFFFGIFFYLIWLARYFYGSKPALSPLKPLLGMFYGNNINDFMPHNYLLWFLPCLFITEILFFCVKKYINKSLTLLIMIMVISIIGYANSFSRFPRLPFGVDVSLNSIPFYYAGFVLKDKMLRNNFNKFVMIILFSLGILFSYLNGRVDMNSNYYGNYFFFIIAAFLNILFWFELSKIIPSSKLLTYVGENSILFFIFHEIAFLILNRIIMLWGAIEPNTVYAMIFAFCGLTILIPVLSFIKNHVPYFLLGKASSNY